MSQTNTQEGKVVFTAKDDLTGKEGYLVELIDDSNVPKFQLPNSNKDLALWVVTDGAAVGDKATAAPIHGNRNIRVKCKGTANTGEVAVLADVGVAADKGKVRTLPATAGQYFAIGVFEEDVADGQLALIRPFPRIISVASTWPVTNANNDIGGLAIGATYSQTEVQALRDKTEIINDDLIALKVVLQAHGIVA